MAQGVRDYTRPITHPARSRTSPLGKTPAAILYSAGVRIRDDAPKQRFVEDRSPIQCSHCGYVPRNTKQGLVGDRCRGQRACEKRYASGDRPYHE